MLSVTSYFERKRAGRFYSVWACNAHDEGWPYPDAWNAMAVGCSRISPTPRILPPREAEERARYWGGARP